MSITTTEPAPGAVAETTTPPRPRRLRQILPEARRIPGNVRGLQVLLLVLSLYAMGQGGLSLYAGLGFGLTADLRDKLYTNQATAGERAELRRQREALLPFWDAWLVYDDLAQITLADAVEKGLKSPAGRALMPEVMRLETEALKRNPAHSYAWARLAYARFVYNGPSALVSELLMHSILCAPHEPPLLPSRIALALQTEKYWSPELREWFPRQLERAWLREKIPTVQAVYAEGYEDRLRHWLADDPVKLKELNEILAGITPRQPKP